ncbi:MAG: SWIM zinc finger family protein [Rhodospirillales bacterium]|nr:SWIM zinc finger family protein [Rhodospirillales bacterium]
MTSATVDVTYAYPFESVVETTRDDTRVRLATSGGRSRHPHFFQGLLLSPATSAELLLIVARVAQSRFYVPPGMLERILREADPVVTCAGERLRFESFSQCCGVYARADLLPAAFEGEFLGRGTTNVDFNPPMRAALAQITAGERVGLNIGIDQVELERQAGKVVERKVRLPQRWLKGFVEVQALASGLRRVHEVPGPEARRFLAAVPAQTKARDRAYLAVNGRQLRISQRAGKGSVAVGGIGRLQVLKPLARRARALRIYGADSGVTGWELELDDARLQVLLSPEAARGFSGEGQVLHDLAGRKAGRALARVRAALAWQPRISPRGLAAQVELDPAAVAGALAALGSRGLVGYDLHDEAYFHRELPFDLTAVANLHPRLNDARKILDKGGVRDIETTGGTVEAFVAGSGVDHRVRLTVDGFRCTCPWFSRNKGAAGPCKHVLALQLTLEDEGEKEAAKAPATDRNDG